MSTRHQIFDGASHVLCVKQPLDAIGARCKISETTEVSKKKLELLDDNLFRSRVDVLRSL